jgi:hypothetical protein
LNAGHDVLGGMGGVQSKSWFESLPSVAASLLYAELGQTVVGDGDGFTLPKPGDDVVAGGAFLSGSVA